MCGLFGFAGPAVDSALLQDLATLAGRRGPHASGWAWWNGRTLALRRFPGSADRHAGALPAALALIGHSRLATSGDHDDLTGAQPIVLARASARARCLESEAGAAGLAIAHNGITRLRVPAPPCETSCDSEALLRLMAVACGSLADRLAAAVAFLQDDAPYAVIAMARGSIAAARRGLPLFARLAGTNLYLCSVAFPGASPLPEREILAWEPSHAE